MVQWRKTGYSGVPGARVEHSLAHYGLVHEVALLTDYGRIAAMLQDGTMRAVVCGHIDLLAEILLCSHMLGLWICDELRNGVGFLVASQHADGTWGEQATCRANRRRHAVQTATAALMAFGSDAPGADAAGARASCGPASGRSVRAFEGSGPGDCD